MAAAIAPGPANLQEVVRMVLNSPPMPLQRPRIGLRRGGGAYLYTDQRTRAYKVGRVGKAPLAKV